MTQLGDLDAVAVVVCRDGRLPAGADESVAEAGGAAVVVGRGASTAASELVGGRRVWWAEVEAGPAGLAGRLAPALAGVPLVILPASPDGRDLAPRLAAQMGRRLLPGAVAVSAAGADLLRVDGRVVVPVEVAGPVVATLLPGARPPVPNDSPAEVEELTVEAAGPFSDPEVVAVVEPDPATMDLADATRVLGGGAGLVPASASDEQARAIFALLTEVAGALGASAGATRVATDAGWTGHERQIGTTGVAIDPDLYVALGVSGASQHTGGLGAPRHTVSVNTDPSAPMTGLADLGLVTDALMLLVELAGRVGVDIPGGVKEVADG
jgi:electron transfer flavoprotein alpha subunit